MYYKYENKLAIEYATPFRNTGHSILTGLHPHDAKFEQKQQIQFVYTSTSIKVI